MLDIEAHTAPQEKSMSRLVETQILGSRSPEAHPVWGSLARLVVAYRTCAAKTELALFLSFSGGFYHGFRSWLSSVQLKPICLTVRLVGKVFPRAKSFQPGSAWEGNLQREICSFIIVPSKLNQH